jgi:hypothetical protein
VYASQVITAAGSGTFNSINGDYTAAGGDYMHRNVPWNPAVNDPTNCSNAAFVDTTAFPLCAQANDAPNGRPATALVGATGGAAAYAGQVAFSDQITACARPPQPLLREPEPNPTGPIRDRRCTRWPLATISATGSGRPRSVWDDPAQSRSVVGYPVTIAGAMNGNGSHTVVTVVSSNTFTVAYGTAGTGGTDRPALDRSVVRWFRPGPPALRPRTPSTSTSTALSRTARA